MGKKKPPLPSRHSRGIKANEVTEIFVDTLREHENAIRANHGWLVPALNEMSAGRPVTLDLPVPASISMREHAHLVDTAARIGVFRLWAKQGRVTYDLNEHLAHELYRSTYEKLPGDIFSHLPHINPLIVLPEPWPVVLGSNEGLVRGFFVYGFNDRPERQTFTNEEVDGLGALLVIDLVNMDTGEVRGQEFMQLRIPTGLKEFTFDQAVEFAGQRVEARYIPRDPKVREQVWETIEELLRPTLAILIYLCCDNRDAEPPAALKNTQARRKPVPRDRDPFWVEVGWRMGPRLHAARRATGRSRGGPGVPSGVQRAAHQRAGHFHKYLVGPGRQMAITRWVMPHWVGLRELPEGVDPITTVVTVDAQRHDPLRRRGLKSRR